MICNEDRRIEHARLSRLQRGQAVQNSCPVAQTSRTHTSYAWSTGLKHWRRGPWIVRSPVSVESTTYTTRATPERPFAAGARLVLHTHVWLCAGVEQRCFQWPCSHRARVATLAWLDLDVGRGAACRSVSRWCSRPRQLLIACHPRLALSVIHGVCSTLAVEPGCGSP